MQAEYSSMNQSYQPENPNVMWVAVALLLSCIATGTMYLYLALQSPAWQLNVVAAAMWSGVVVVSAGTILVWRQRTQLGIWLIIGSIVLLTPVTALLVSDIGVVMGLVIFVVVPLIASQALSSTQFNWAIGVGIVSGVGSLLLGLWEGSIQLPVPEVQTVNIIISVVLVVILVILTLRQFSDFSLRVKLIIGFIGVSLLALAVVSAVSQLTIRPQLEQDVADDLKAVSTSQAAAIGNILARQIEALEALSQSSPLVVEIKFANASYLQEGESEPDLERVITEIKALDSEWQTAAITSRLVNSRLVTGGSAFDLTQFKKFFPDHDEVFVTDKYGALFAATRRTALLYHGEQEWWQAAYNNGQGGVYIGTPEFNENTQSFGIRIAMPIHAIESDEVIGVLHSYYGLTALNDLLTSVSSGGPIAIDLYFPDGSLLEGHPHISSNVTKHIDMSHLSPDTLAQIDPMKESYLKDIEYDGESSFVSQEYVLSSTGNPIVDDLKWRVVTHEDRDAALAPVNQQTNNNLTSALIISLIATLGAIVVSQRLTGPIVNLTNLAEQITAGDLTKQIPVETKDEIGTLAAALNLMTNRLRETIDSLEERVVDRTRRLETLVNTSQRLSGILDSSDLMRQVVTLTKETFNYYHVHIYLLDQTRETLIMTEGYGDVGAEMKRRVHTIDTNGSKSLVARAARMGETIIVEDVRQNPEWLPNRLLPDTQAEMAVPIKINNEVVGVLDVQSDRVGGLTVEDETTVQALTGQIATAMQNAQLFAETQDALYKAQRLQRLYTEQAWNRFTTEKISTQYESRQVSIPELEKIETPEVVAAIQQRGTVQLKLGHNSQNDGDTEDKMQAIHPGDTQELKRRQKTGSALATPLTLGGKTIGVLGIRDDNQAREWTSDEIALIEAVSEQMSLAIENARLFEESRRNAWRNRIVNESTAEVWSSAEIEEVMKAAVAQLGSKLGASEVVIRLGNEDELGQE